MNPLFKAKTLYFQAFKPKKCTLKTALKSTNKPIFRHKTGKNKIKSTKKRPF